MTSVQSVMEVVTLKPSAATVKEALPAPANQDSQEMDIRVQVIKHKMYSSGEKRQRRCSSLFNNCKNVALAA